MKPNPKRLRRIWVAAGAGIVGCLACSVAGILLGPPTSRSALSTEDAAATVLATAGIDSLQAVRTRAAVPTATPEPMAPTHTALAQDAPTQDVPAPTDVPDPTRPIPQSPVDVLRATGREICGPDFLSAEYFPQGSSVPVALVECRLKEGFSADATVGVALLNFRDLVVKVLPRTEFPFLRLILHGQFTAADGTTSERPAFTFVMTKDLYDQVQWNATTRKDLGQLLQNKTAGASVAMHAAWRDDWKAYIAD